MCPDILSAYFSAKLPENCERPLAGLALRASVTSPAVSSDRRAQKDSQFE